MLKKIKSRKGDGLYLPLLNILATLSLSVMDRIGMFYAEPLDISHFHAMMRTINDYSFTKELLETDRTEVFEIMDTLRSLFHTSGIKHFSMIRSGTYKTGGGICIITEHEKHRAPIFNIYLQLKKIYSSLHIPYISFIDGENTDG